jgi:hypothetical protein
MLVIEQNQYLSRSNVVNLKFSVVLSKVERAFTILLAERICLVDLGVFWKLAIGFEITGLIRSILYDHIGLVVLEFPKR